MTHQSEEWERITELLAFAAELPPDQRRAWLQRTGEAGPVVERVQELLAAYDEDPGFLETLDSLPNQLGPWIIQRELGRGGMGRVFEAIHQDPAISRRVALKVVGAGRVVPALLESFLRERAILARLEHPAIARLYDTGSSPSGIPYFAMELVDGIPFDHWLEQRNPSLRLRIQLIAAITSAVESAHRLFIAHGDLKPSNILITAKDEPRLLDFGIAQIWNHPSDDPLPLLTPAHASPEQLAGESISAASDIYQLGRLLKLAAPDTNGEIAAIRARCLEEQPLRRYQTAGALLDDLHAWLDCRPISVVRSTVLYRFRKFLRRRPLAAMLSAALSVAVAATVWQAYRAERHRAEALRQFEETRRFSRSLLASIPSLPSAAQHAFVEKTAELLERSSMNQEQDPKLQLELAYAWMLLGQVQGLPTAKNLGDPQSAARSHARAIALAESARAAQPRQALPMLAALYAGAARVELACDRDANAEALTLKLEALLEDLKAFGPSEELASGYSDNAFLRGRKDQQRAKALYQLAVEAFDQAGASETIQKAYALKRWGAVLLSEGELEGGVARYQQALAIERAQSIDPMDLSFTLSDLGLACRRQRRYADAEAYYKEAIAIREDAYAHDPQDTRVHASLASACWRLGWVYADAGRPEDAIPLGRRSVELYELLAAPPRDHRQSLQQLALAQVYLAEFLTLAAAKQSGLPGDRTRTKDSRSGATTGPAWQRPDVQEIQAISRRLPEARRLIQAAAAHHARYPKAELAAELNALGYAVPQPTP